MNIVKKITKINNLFFVILISLAFIDYLGYWYVYILFPIIYAIFKKKLLSEIDGSFIILIIFGIVYSIFASLPGTASTYAIIVIIYPFSYLLGKSIRRSESDYAIMNVLFIISLSVAAFSIMSILKDVSINGFYLSSRDLILEGSGINEEMAATGIFSKLMLLVTFISVLYLSLPKNNKIIYIVFAIIAIFCSLRLQSRTSLVILGIVLCLPILLNSKVLFKKNKFSLISSILFVILAIIYIYQNYSTELGVLERFQTENVEDGGGRGERALDVIDALVENPMGGLTNMRYAHNLWLDCARVAGIIPLFLLIIITIKFIVATWKTYKGMKLDFNYRYVVFTMSISLIIYFNVEPILEGVPILFAYFCLLFGMLSGHRSLIIRN